MEDNTLSASRNHDKLARILSFCELSVQACRGGGGGCQCSDSNDPSCSD